MIDAVLLLEPLMIYAILITIIAVISVFFNFLFFLANKKLQALIKTMFNGHAQATDLQVKIIAPIMSEKR